MSVATIRWAALVLGLVLFAVTLAYVDLPSAVAAIRRLGLAMPIALAFSGLWHLARTWAWAACFPQPRAIGFARLARVRLAAEAFSFLTIRGIAGEPLKVVLLTDAIDPRIATAAVALERLAYMVGTTLIVGAASIVALLAVPLTPIWFRIFRAFAIFGGGVALITTIVIAGHGTYLQAGVRLFDRKAGTAIGNGRVARFLAAVERLMLDLVRGSPARLAILAVSTVLAFACMVLEAWVVLRAVGAPITMAGAIAVETFSRVASFASALIPGNIGALEAMSVAAASAVGATAGGAALAVARRIRGLFWAGIGLAVYPPTARTGRTGHSRRSVTFS